ncbi:hypothetical protein [Polymorphospora rubra]|uniref:Uncharacterized protein n=1 Tax=Polymorphospora rubra TaxID=338584 RepID=A0A810N3W7_9ACTN|nr:hypothetical protein [Polymorphospora rubra]BCJ67264.1 hypothetical protein Prubr_42850 [Polymorphospora rubra]
MSHSLMKRFLGTAAAVTTGLLLLAASAQAAPKTEAAGGEPAKATVSVAEIEANNAAVWASLPPNVTMTVIGKMPKLQGPIDHYTQNGPTTTTGVTPLAVDTLPYAFTFSGVRNLYGRDFTSTQTIICKDVEATWDFPYGSHHEFKITLRSSWTVTVPTDGVARTFCWSGVPTNTTLWFRYFSTGNTGGDYAFASGSGQVRYP